MRDGVLYYLRPSVQLHRGPVERTTDDVKDSVVQRRASRRAYKSLVLHSPAQVQTDYAAWVYDVYRDR